MPVLNNYASLVSEDYNTVYARSLTIIGLASSGAKIALIVPIGDSLTPNGRVNGEEFLYAVADYIETYSDLTFTVLCESRHNPYGITDEYFNTEIEPEVTAEATETAVATETAEATETAVATETEEYVESITPETTAELVTDENTALDSDTLSVAPVESDTVQTETGAEPSEIEWTETELSIEESTEPPKLQNNKTSDGFIVPLILKSFGRCLKSSRSCILRLIKALPGVGIRILIRLSHLWAFAIPTII